jgi:hypothetical protein
VVTPTRHQVPPPSPPASADAASAAARLAGGPAVRRAPLNGAPPTG